MDGTDKRTSQVQQARQPRVGWVILGAHRAPRERGLRRFVGARGLGLGLGLASVVEAREGQGATLVHARACAREGRGYGRGRGRGLEASDHQGAPLVHVRARVGAVPGGAGLPAPILVKGA